MTLQRMLGNRATVELLRAGQAKLAVGPALDPSEAEADAVAHAVVQRLAGSSGPPSSEVGDPEEREGVSRAVAGTVSRVAEVGHAGGSLSPETEATISEARRGGAPLPGLLRTTMESAFDADFSKVRVHADERSAGLNDSVAAKAFTIGNDIFFRDGLPDTSTRSGQHLLAHELTHTIQQGASGRAETQGQRVARGQALQRFPASVLSTPAPWQNLRSSVKRPGEGQSGGVYILTSAEQDAEVKTVVVKPVFAENGLGLKDSAAQLTFGDRAIASLFGVNTPTSRSVLKGSAEFDQLLALCSPHQPPKPVEQEGMATPTWEPLTEATGFVVMAEVPNATSLESLASKAGSDAEASDRLDAAVFDPAFLRQLGRVCIGDLLIGNVDRIVLGAENLGNLMVSQGTRGQELWAIDTSAVLGGKFDPANVANLGNTIGAGRNLTNVKKTINAGPEVILDSFFNAVVKRVERNQPEVGELQIGPAELLRLTYQAKRESALEAFAAGWTSALETVQQLIETKTGRQNLKGLTAEVSDQPGAEEVSYSALKTNAMYLGNRAKGHSHEEAAKDPAGYAALTQLARFDPSQADFLDDGHSWNVARVPSGDALTARLEDIDALPGDTRLTHVVVEKYKKYDAAVFQEILEAASKAKQDVSGLGTKKRGRVSKPRNRVVAGQFVAETYELGAAALRAASLVELLRGTAKQLNTAMGASASPNQAARALPAAEFVESTNARLHRDFGEYSDRLRAASAAVGKLRRYGEHKKLADALARIANHVEEGDDRLSKEALLANPRLYTNVLKSIMAR